jgi:2-polyprenyl-3-methyl-5-hydroxy-6-metoxy-1,4-benzoquinol methylase
MKCPVCQSNENKKNFGEYIQCDTCKSLFLKKLPPTKLLQNQAEKDADIMITSVNEKIEAIHISRFNKIKKYVTKKDKIVDVGCGYGTFLQVVKKEGYIPIAMDVSQKLIDHLKSKGIHGYTSMKDIAEHSMSAVTGYDVIEHTTTPQLFIQQIKRIMKNNAVIMLTTPNATGISGRILKEKWWVFGPDAHCVLFSPFSLKQLLEKNGFEVISLRTDSFTRWYASNNTLLKKIANKLLFLSFMLIQKPAYTQLLGDNIEIIARLKKK